MKVRGFHPTIDTLNHPDLPQRLTVTNSGTMAGQEVVFCPTHDPKASTVKNYIENMVIKLLYLIPACHVSQSGQHIVPTLLNVPKEKRAFLARSCKQKHQNMIIVTWSAWPFWRSLPSMYVLRNAAHLLHTWWLPNAKTLPSLFLASAALLRQLTGLTTRRAPFSNRNRISRSVDLSIGGS